MALLSDKDREFLQNHFEETLIHPVKLVFFTQEIACQFCRETGQILDEAACREDHRETAFRHQRRWPSAMDRQDPPPSSWTWTMDPFHIPWVRVHLLIEDIVDARGRPTCCLKRERLAHRGAGAYPGVRDAHLLLLAPSRCAWPTNWPSPENVRARHGRGHHSLIWRTGTASTACRAPSSMRDDLRAPLPSSSCRQGARGGSVAR